MLLGALLADTFLRHVGVLEGSSDVFGRLWDTFGIMGWLLVVILCPSGGAFFGLFWGSENHEKHVFSLSNFQDFDGIGIWRL